MRWLPLARALGFWRLGQSYSSCPGSRQQGQAPAFGCESAGSWLIGSTPLQEAAIEFDSSRCRLLNNGLLGSMNNDVDRRYQKHRRYNGDRQTTDDRSSE